MNLGRPASELYYPSMVVNLHLRFDETLMVVTDDRYYASAQTKQADDMQDPPQESPYLEPLVKPGQPPSAVLNRIPIKASVELPGIRQAGKFHLTFDYRVLPIDPRLMSAIAVEIHLGAVKAGDFSDGIGGVVWGDAGGGGQVRSVLRTRDAAGIPDNDSLLMIGTCDMNECSYDGQGQVHLEGRDFRGLLLDGKIPPKDIEKINLQQPISKVVGDILETITIDHTVKIDVKPIGFVGDKEPSPADSGGLTRCRMGADGNGAKSQPAGGDKLSYWDLITNYCQPRDALVWREDLSWAPISTVQVGDHLMGFAPDGVDRGRNFRKYAIAEVEEIFTRKAPVVALHLESGRIVRCTGDHHWFTGRSEPAFAFMPPKVGRPLIRVVDDPAEAFVPDGDYQLGYARGIIDGDGAFIDKIYEYDGKKSRTKHITVAMNDTVSLGRYVECCHALGLTPYESIRTDRRSGYQQPCVRLYTQRAIDMLIHSTEPSSDNYAKGWLAGIFDAEGCTSNSLEICQYREVNADIHAAIAARLQRFGFDRGLFWNRVHVYGGVHEMLRFFYLVQPAAAVKFQKHLLGMKMGGTSDRVVRIEPCGEEEVVSLRTSTHTYFGQGYASRNCFLVGAVPYFQGQTLYIRPARDIYSQLLDDSQPTPFAGAAPREIVTQGAQGPTTEKLHVRRLVYGRNIESLSYQRKYGGVKVPIVEVSGIDDTVRGDQKLLVEQWPPLGSDAALAVGENDKVRIPIHGIRSREQMRVIAHDLYEEIGRGEIGGSCKTKVLSSFGGDNEDPDLIRLRPTDAVELTVDIRALNGRAPLVSELTEQNRRPFDEQVQVLSKLLGDDNLARALVATQRSSIVDGLRWFRTSNVKFDWDGSKSGIAISFDFQNYIVARHGASAAAQPAVKSVTRTVSKTAAKAIPPRGTGAAAAATPGNAAAAQGAVTHAADSAMDIARGQVNTGYWTSYNAGLKDANETTAQGLAVPGTIQYDVGGDAEESVRSAVAQSRKRP